MISNQSANRFQGIRWLMLLLAGWGCLIAAGTWIFAPFSDWRKPLIVILTTGALLAIWLAVALRKRNSRLNPRRSDP